jgi:hypothetical protein
MATDVGGGRGMETMGARRTVAVRLVWRRSLRRERGRADGVGGLTAMAEARGGGMVMVMAMAMEEVMGLEMGERVGRLERMMENPKDQN